MKKTYQAIITRWSDEEKKQVQVVAGTFNEYRHAAIFAKAYAEEFCATVQIKEYRLAETFEIKPQR